MAGEPLLEQSLDVMHGTLEKLMHREPPINCARETYKDLNLWLAPGIMQVTGDALKGFHSDGTVGNAKFVNPWAPTALIAKNITKEYTLPIQRHCQGGMLFNKVEASVNSGAERIFDVVKLQYRKARAELADVKHAAMWGTLTGADDVDSPAGIPYWIVLGTQGSTGGWNGYQSRYNDGSTPGATFDCAGLNSSAAVNPNFSNYFADHQGNIDESLWGLVSSANMRLNFQGPTSVEGSSVPTVKYVVFTTINVIETYKKMILKMNAQVGPQPMTAGYLSTADVMLPGGIPMNWSNILDTANVSLWGTDPIYGLNMNKIYPVYLNGWNDVLTEEDAPTNHLVRQKFIDWCGQMAWSDERKRAGFLISNHPSN